MYMKAGFSEPLDRAIDVINYLNKYFPPKKQEEPTERNTP